MKSIFFSGLIPIDFIAHKKKCVSFVKVLSLSLATKLQITLLLFFFFCMIFRLKCQFKLYLIDPSSLQLVGRVMT